MLIPFSEYCTRDQTLIGLAICWPFTLFVTGLIVQDVNVPLVVIVIYAVTSTASLICPIVFVVAWITYLEKHGDGPGDSGKELSSKVRLGVIILTLILSGQLLHHLFYRLA